MASPKDNRKQRILEVFTSHGGLMTIRQLAEYCIDDGVYSVPEMNLMVRRAIQGEARDALKRDRPDGLPFAGPLARKAEGDEDGHPWGQLELWGEEDSLFNINERDEQLRADNKRLVKLIDNHEARWGYRPTTSLLTSSILAESELEPA